MSTIANLLVNMGADFSGSESAFTNFLRMLGVVEDQAKSTTGSLHSLGEGGDEAGGHLEHMKETAHELGEEFLKLTREALELTGLFEVLKESVKVSAELESTRVAITAFTGSSEKAAEMVEKLEEVSREEALKFPEIMPAAQHMMALGFSTEQSVKAIQAAGNASWALGQPLESITQRMGMMAMSGMVNQRMLRTLGVNMDELGRIMGVSAADVTKAFRMMSEDSKLETLSLALEKFGDLGAKEANTVAGGWINLKNTWHEAFKNIGDDLQELTKFLERFGTTAGNFMSDAFSNNPNIDALKILIDAVKNGSSYEEASKQAHRFDMTPVLPPEGEDETGFLGKAKIQEEAIKGMAKERAKEEAALLLARLKNEEEAVKATAELRRAEVEAAITSRHDENMVAINAIQDQLTRERAAAAENIRMAQERETRITEINVAETAKRRAIERRRDPLEIAAKYEIGPQGEVDPAKQALIEAQVHAETAGKIQALDANLAKEREKLAAGTASAIGHSADSEANSFRSAAVKIADDWYEFFNTVSKGADEADNRIEENAQKLIDENARLTVEMNKGDTQSALQKNQERRLALEREYSTVLISSLANQIEEVRRIADIDEDDLRIKAAQLDAEAELARRIGDVVTAERDHNAAVALRNEIKNKEFETQTKINDLLKSTDVGRKLFEDLKGFDLGGTIARGVTEPGRGRQGENIGMARGLETQLSSAFKNLGKELFGDALKGIMTQLVRQIAANTAVQAILHSIFGVNIAATTANTASTNVSTAVTHLSIGAIISHMGALIAHGAIVVAHGVVVVANTIATIANTLWTIILAAVEAVKGFFGFAEGGRPPLDRASIVGEEGRELFVPDQPGTIIPNKETEEILEAVKTPETEKQTPKALENSPEPTREASRPAPTQQTRSSTTRSSTTPPSPLPTQTPTPIPTGTPASARERRQETPPEAPTPERNPNVTDRGFLRDRNVTRTDVGQADREVTHNFSILSSVFPAAPRAERNIGLENNPVTPEANTGAVTRSAESSPPVIPSQVLHTGAIGLDTTAIAALHAGVTQIASDHSISTQQNTFQIYGGGNPREVVRQIATFMKSSSSRFATK